ncbi:MAG TPA: divalent-cation tolerance protein CutA [Longimicrobium sp.]|uniref:divalent-cation tolerance protein CutA n=1 Tax=Longimicrobium sp. TaxID=2029185 RepID=UPI002ED85AB2
MSGEEASRIVIAFSTAPDPATAERIARALVDEGLIACANLVPGLTSVYRWEGQVHADPEVLLLIKTRRENVPRLKERLPELHPYQVPELVVAPVEDGLAPYCRWVMDETRP